MSDNISKVRSRLDSIGADACVLTLLPDVRWVSGFTGSNGILIVDKKAVHLVTDGRYTLQAHLEVNESKVQVHIAPHDIYEYVSQQHLFGEAERVVFQADHLTWAAHDDLASCIPHASLIPQKEFLSALVAAKTSAEVERIQEAQRITEDVFGYLLGWIRAGLSEKEVSAEIVYQHLKRGAQGMSFEPIVASGSRAALPHARPTDKLLADGELVILDFGCVYEGYASDMTRTIAIGWAGEEARQAYDVVLDSQNRAIGAARAGMLSEELDHVARIPIEEANLGEFFTHGLGHGVGLQIHEWPRISRGVKYKLPLDAVVTIEPGVYLPGKFGIRIEDMVLLGKERSSNLTSASKDLIVLKA